MQLAFQKLPRRHLGMFAGSAGGRGMPHSLTFNCASTSAPSGRSLQIESASRIQFPVPADFPVRRMKKHCLQVNSYVERRRGSAISQIVGLPRQSQAQGRSSQLVAGFCRRTVQDSLRRQAQPATWQLHSTPHQQFESRQLCSKPLCASTGNGTQHSSWDEGTEAAASGEEVGSLPRKQEGSMSSGEEREGMPGQQVATEPSAEGQEGGQVTLQRKRELHVVLVHPQIPGNTGSIARTCAATAVWLHLVKPMGFEIDDTKLKRAGLDYWPHVVMNVHEDWAAFYGFFQKQNDPKRLIAFSKKGSVPHYSLDYKLGDWLLFGAETTGLPPEAFTACTIGRFAGGVARIPIDESYVRSLNLSVAAGIGVYEAIRQIECVGELEPVVSNS